MKQHNPRSTRLCKFAKEKADEVKEILPRIAEIIATAIATPLL